ncbi:MAG: mismatch-specific DNA-glycosylase [Actinomycetota bacterium]|nr:mismatch-specific DNA-glycosylase [Actinomycetota bacterium]
MPRTPRAARPAPADLAAAYGRVVPDLVGPGVRVLLCGINPSLWSGAVGLHFANPSNRLWTVLQASGWTAERLRPEQTDEVLAAGLGITNLVARATARADELADEELRAGLPAVAALAGRVRPVWVAFLGLSAYRVATGDRGAGVGPQDRRTGPARTWLLPNPSGLNASWQVPRLAEEYARLRGASAHPDAEDAHREQAEQGQGEQEEQRQHDDEVQPRQHPRRGHEADPGQRPS